MGRSAHRKGCTTRVTISHTPARQAWNTVVAAVRKDRRHPCVRFLPTGTAEAKLLLTGKVRAMQLLCRTSLQVRRQCYCVSSLYHCCTTSHTLMTSKSCATKLFAPTPVSHQVYCLRRTPSSGTSAVPTSAVQITKLLCSAKLCPLILCQVQLAMVG